ncbi:BnaAnng17160D [Brassica napus]|uniref:BnaAnng17160D protein n=1 Tax=Brassica napus TaxID=3708 RepID=A0A078JA67_BRANA|nr:BnaAnng17160D [Brassica napus]
MSTPRVFFSDLKSGKCSSAVDMILIDVNATMMQATIYANRLSRFRSKLAAGTMYTISGYDLTDSPLMIRFNDSTAFDELAEPPTRVHSYQVQSLQKPFFFYCLDEDSTVTLSLFESQAEAFHKRLEDMHGDPRVVVATSINPKMIGGGLFLNATSGTHVYFDKETKPGEDYFYKLVARDNGVPSAAPLLKGYAKVETLTISELISFVASAQPQDIDFVCTGRVVRLDVDKGWCYVACAKCSKKLQRTVSALECVRCSNPNAVGVLRYRLELAIADSTAEGTFVCFDGVMTKLHNLRASEAGQMLAVEGENPEDMIVPPFINDMEGKTLTFQVRVSAFNFTAHHQTFTITRILKEHERIPAPDFVGGNDEDDNNLGGGGHVPVRNDSGEGSSGPDKKADGPPADTAVEKSSRSSTSAAKKARVV